MCSTRIMRGCSTWAANDEPDDQLVVDLDVNNSSNSTPSLRPSVEAHGGASRGTAPHGPWLAREHANRGPASIHADVDRRPSRPRTIGLRTRTHHGVVVTEQVTGQFNRQGQRWRHRSRAAVSAAEVPVVPPARRGCPSVDSTYVLSSGTLCEWEHGRTRGNG